MIDAAERAGGPKARALITVVHDPVIKAIVDTWPQALAADRAVALGLTADQTLDGIVAAYMDDYGQTALRDG